MADEPLTLVINNGTNSQTFTEIPDPVAYLYSGRAPDGRVPVGARTWEALEAAKAAAYGQYPYFNQDLLEQAGYVVTGGGTWGGNADVNAVSPLTVQADSTVEPHVQDLVKGYGLEVDAWNANKAFVDEQAAALAASWGLPAIAIAAAPAGKPQSLTVSSPAKANGGAAANPGGQSPATAPPAASPAKSTPKPPAKPPKSDAELKADALRIQHLQAQLATETALATQWKANDQANLKEVQAAQKVETKMATTEAAERAPKK